MKKYIITGGKGFIGSKITTRIDGRSFDLKSELDILNKKQFLEACADTAGIFHCAARISLPESIKMPKEYYQTNVVGTKNVAEVAEKLGLKVVFSSSAAVYGEYNYPINEGTQLHGAAPYAKNKIEGEEILRKLKIPAVALRYFNVYGPGQSPEYAGVVTAFITRALKGENLIINGTGEQVRDFVFVSDVVDANILAMECIGQNFQVFNIGSGEKVTINQLAGKILNLTGSSSKIIHVPTRQGDVAYSQADISKAKNILGWTPTVSLDEGLGWVIDYYKKLA